MSYPRKLLNDGEDVVVDLNPHWWFLIGPMVAVVVALAAGGYVIAQIDEQAVLYAAAALLVASAAWLLVRYLQWVTIEFVVTTDRLIYRRGVLAKHGREIPLERIDNVTFNQSILERVIRTGDLIIESAGEGSQQPFSNIRRPSEVQNQIYRQIEANTQRDMRPLVQQAAPVATVAEQLEQLHALHQKGILSADEYEAKRQALIERL